MLARRLAATFTMLALTAGLVSFTAGPLEASGDEVTIEMSIVGFSPSNLTIPTGSTVTWLNTERLDYPVLQGTHRLSSEDGSLQSMDIPPGAAFTATFNLPTTISYVCELHPHTMTGSLTVVGDPVLPAPTEKTVKIVEPSSTDANSWGFDPKELKVEVGTTVTWRNTGAVTHTVTSDDAGFDSGNLAAGKAFSFTFTRSAAISYYCKPHPWMTGTILVSKPGEAPPKIPTKKPGSGGSDPGPPIVLTPPARQGNQPATWQARIVEGSISDPSSWGYAPESLSVQAGDSVVWTNAGSIAHTVTSADGTFDSGDLAAGSRFSFTFPNTGTFAFACKPHPWMTGVIQVVPKGVDATTVAPPQPPAPRVQAPGGSSSAGGSDGETAEVKDISGSDAEAAWTVGAIGLAAGTGVGLFGVGALIAVLGALQLRRQRSYAASIAEATAAMDVIDLTQTQVLVETAVPVAAGAPVARKVAKAPSRARVRSSIDADRLTRTP